MTKLTFKGNKLQFPGGGSIDYIPPVAQITDYDGNVYTSTVIGNQEWLIDNLKTTHYNNGDVIPNITNNTDWGNNTIGAMCWYNTDIANKDIQGGYYNKMAAQNVKGICPTGFKVPTLSDFATLLVGIGAPGLEDFEYDEAITGLRAIYDGWALDNGTNITGFNAFPYDFRLTNGNWMGLYDLSFIMYLIDSSVEIMDMDEVYRKTYDDNYGFNIRCMRDI